MPKLNILGDPSEGQDYPDVDSAAIRFIAIFPPLGISRVGDSDLDCFLAPEVPGQISPPQGLCTGTEFKFRDAQQKLRRQAVRFRAFAYGAQNQILGELNAKNGYNLTWTVQVANKKPANFVFQRTGRFDPSNTALRNPKVQAGLSLEDRHRLYVESGGQISMTSRDPIVLSGPFHGSQEDSTEIELAQLQRDSVGRLVFVPGRGDAHSVTTPGKPHPQITSEFDNTDWIDEICDGTVKLSVMKGSWNTNRIPVLAAKVLSAPPKFAWGLKAHTNLYDDMENIYRLAGNRHVPPPTRQNLDFWKHIWPVLHAASLMSWTNNAAFQGHGSFANGHFDADRIYELFKGPAQNQAKKEERNFFKARIFEKLRKPLDDDNIDNTQANVRYMPLLSGDIGDMVDPGLVPGGLQPDARRFASITKLQYERFKIWNDNEDFYLTDNDVPPVAKSKLEDFELSQRPEALTRAVLEPTIGDPLFPGIEMYWIAKLADTYDTLEIRVVPPFRIDDRTILEGHLTRGLSLPWQCDFDLCELHWWPAVRPDDVVPKVLFDATVQNSKAKEDFDAAIANRAQWTRGLRESVAYSAASTEWVGSDDMLRYWRYLGVVREAKDVFTDKDSRKYTAFLEDERLAV